MRKCTLSEKCIFYSLDVQHCRSKSFHVVIINIIFIITFLLQGYNIGGGPIYLTQVSCTGSELKLLDCAYINPTRNTMLYRNDVEIQCNPGT